MELSVSTVTNVNPIHVAKGLPARTSAAVTNVNATQAINPMVLANVKTLMNVLLTLPTTVQSTLNVITSVVLMNVNALRDTNHLAANVLTSTNANSMFVILMLHAAILLEDLNAHVMLDMMVMV
jgi:hypothetical protein